MAGEIFHELTKSLGLVECLRPVRSAIFAALVLCASLPPATFGQTTATSVTLTWTAKGDDGSTGTATTYDLRYATSPITAANWIAATQVTGEPSPKAAGQSEALTVSGLSPSTTYYFALKVADEIPNWSGLSNVISRTTLPEAIPPASIASLALGTRTTTSIVLNWVAPGDDSTSGTASQYDIRYATSAITTANFAAATQVTGEPAPKSAGTAETFTVTGLSANTTYYFAVKTADEVPNWSGLSNVASGATTQESTPPSTIANLGAGSETSTAVQLSWTAPGDDGNIGTAAQYDIRYSTSNITNGNFASASQATGEPAPAAPGTASAFTVTGLNANTAYYFAIKTADEVPNWSALSNVVSRTTLPEQNPPSAVTTLVASNPTSTSITLNWIAVGDDGTSGTANRYEIRYSVNPINAANFSTASLVASPPVPKATGQPEQFAVSGLAATTTYHFALKVADEVPNWSSISNVVSATTGGVDGIPPDPVNDLSAAPGTNLGELALQWHATGDDGRTGTARLYEIRYSPNPLNITNFGVASLWPTPPIPKSSGSAESLVMTGLPAGQRLNVAVRVYDESGNVSGISNIASGIVQFNFGTSTDEIASLASPPSGSTVATSRPILVIDNLLSGSGNIYYFEVAADSGFLSMRAFGTVGEQAGGQTYWQVDPPLISGSTFFWRVSANNYGYSAISNFTVQSQAHAYPNPFRPAQSAAAVFADLPLGSDLALTTVSGEPVRHWSNVTDDVRWDGTNAQGQPVASGVYLWSVPNAKSLGKIIVIR